MKTKDYPVRIYGNIYEMSDGTMHRYGEHPLLDEHTDFDNVPYIRADIVAPRWHKYSEEKPSKAGWYLVQFSSFGMDVVFYCNGFAFDGQVIAWQELSKPDWQ